jgi:hypothetical protein
MKPRKNIFRVLLTDLKVPVRSSNPSTKLSRKQKENISILDGDLEVPYTRKLSLGQYVIGLKNWVMMVLLNQK